MGWVEKCSIYVCIHTQNILKFNWYLDFTFKNVPMGILIKEHKLTYTGEVILALDKMNKNEAVALDSFRIKKVNEMINEIYT